MSRFLQIAAAAFAASLVVTTAGRAQGVRLHFGVAGSLTFPTGDFHADPVGDGYNVGWQGMAVLDAEPTRSGLGYRVEGSYGENPANQQLKTDLTALAGMAADSRVKMAGGSVDLVYYFRRPPRAPRAYVLGGVGFYRVTVSLITSAATSDTSETKFAWNIGGGFALESGNVEPFFEWRYVGVEALSGFPRTDYLPITVGIRFRV